MINQALLASLNNILGVGKPSSRGNYKFNCFKIHRNGLPDTTHKLEICLDPNSEHYQSSHCWSCDLRAKTLKSLLKPLNLTPNTLTQLKLVIEDENTLPIEGNSQPHQEIELPKDFIPLFFETNDIMRKHAVFYLKKRGIESDEFIKYNIGYCNKGPYKNRIIIPSYDEQGNLNYFIARTFEEGNKLRYINPPISKDIIPFEYFINWNLPIILVEGAFDMISLKRNTIPLLGKIIQEGLMKKLIESKVNRIYICLDKEIIKKSLDYCEQLMDQGKKVYLVELDEKDPNQMGFEKIVDKLHKTKSLTFSTLLENKLKYG